MWCVVLLAGVVEALVEASDDRPLEFDVPGLTESPARHFSLNCFANIKLKTKLSSKNSKSSS